MRTLAPGALGGDAGEMQFVSYILSLPHPTGYPLQTLLGKLWATAVPLGSVAYRLNLLSAVASAAAVGLVYGTIRLSSGSRVGALVAALLLGVSQVFWGQALLADKYALNGLLLALVLYSLAWWSQAPAERNVGWCAFAYGLSLAHHRSMLVFLPLLVGYCLWRDRRLLRQWRYAGPGALLMAGPLVLYLWLPIALGRSLPPGTWHPRSPGQWLAYLQDQGFLASIKPQGDLWQKLAFYGGSLLAQFTPPGVLLGLAGVVRQARQRQPLALFLMPGFLLQAALSASYEVPRNWVFFLPSFLLFSLWIGEGIAWALQGSSAVSARSRPLGYGVAGLTLAACLLLVGVPLRSSCPGYREAHLDGGSLDLWRQDLKSGFQAQRFAMSSLAVVEPNSIVVCDWEQATPLWYFQQVEGQRPDVTITYPMDRWREALATGRPTYLARTVPGVSESYRLTTAGPLVRVSESPASRLPEGVTGAGIDWAGQIELAGYRLQNPDCSGGYVLPVSLYFRALAPLPANYSLSLRLFSQDGSKVWSEDRDRFALGMYLTSRWLPGELVGDYFEVPLPRRLPAGRYRLGILLYEAKDGSFRNLTLDGGEGDIAYLPAVDVPPRR